MDKNRAMLLWVAGAAGVILLVAAFKGKNPSSILSGYATAKPDPNPMPTPPTSGGGGIVRPEFVATADGGLEDVPAVYAQNPALFVPSVTQ